MSEKTTTPSCTAAILGLVTLCLVSASSLAAEGHLLRLRPAADGAYSFQIVQTQNSKINLGPLGSQEVTGEVTFNGTQKVGSVSDDQLEVRVVYDRFQMKLNQMGQETVIDSQQEGSETEVLTQIVGKPITINLDSLGRVKSVQGFADAMSGATEGLAQTPETAPLNKMLKEAFSDDAVLAMFQQTQTIFPQAAVTIGETWSSSSEIKNPALGQVRIDSTYTLQEVAEHDGRKRAKLNVATETEVQGKMPLVEQLNTMFAAQGGSMDIQFGEMTASGHLWVDMATGLTEEMTIDQTLEIKMDLSLAGQEVPMAMEIQSVTEQTLSGF